MSAPAQPSVLHLVVAGLDPARRAELNRMAAERKTEILELTEANAQQALEKVFAADHVAVWGAVDVS